MKEKTRRITENVLKILNSPRFCTLIIIFSIAIIINTNQVNAETQIFCGGDKDLLISCLGNQELNHLGYKIPEPSITGQALGSPRKFNYTPIYLGLIALVLVCAIVLLIAIMKKSRKNSYSY